MNQCSFHDGSSVAECRGCNPRLRNLTERLHRAVERLGSLASDPDLNDYEAGRLHGKIEGVNLALSYIEEERNDRS